MTTTLDRLLTRHGRTYAHELGIDLADDPEPLFQLLVGALLMSTRISTGIAVDAARVLFRRGWTTPAAMHDPTWQQRVTALGEGGYVRYDESTSRYLAETSAHLLETYDGDLRRLRGEADGDVGAVRRGLKACKGIGDVGADIFLREVQGVWTEVRPFVDARTLGTARELELADDVDGLVSLVDEEDLPRLLAALVRARLTKDLHAVRGEVEDPPLTATQLAIATKDELYAVARSRDLSGRSSMTRDELADALRDD